MDLPSCNISKTVHNKWLQMSGKRGNNLFDAKCDDSIRAWMQMTNYRAYLKGYALGSGPSKGELRLHAARRSGDPKKIAEALNTLPRAEGVEPEYHTWKEKKHLEARKGSWTCPLVMQKTHIGRTRSTFLSPA